MKNLPFLLSFTCALFIQFQALAQEASANEELYHVLLLRWQEQADSSQKASVLEDFRGLVPKIEGFENIRIIRTIRANKGHQLLIIMRFSNSEALAKYQEHPDHLKLKQSAQPYIQDLTKFDYRSAELKSQ